MEHSTKTEENKLSNFVALAVEPDGTTKRLIFTRDNSLRVFQNAVGGLIEPVRIAPTLEMYVNEEGILLGLEKNILATAIATSVFSDEMSKPYYLLGTAVFIGGVDYEGYTRGLDDRILNTLEMLATMARLETALEITTASFDV